MALADLSRHECAPEQALLNGKDPHALGGLQKLFLKFTAKPLISAGQAKTGNTTLSLQCKLNLAPRKLVASSIPSPCPAALKRKSAWYWLQ